MPEETFVTKINGEDAEVILDTDPPWYKTEQLLKSGVSFDTNGKQSIDMIAFLDKMLDVVIIKLGKLDVKNRTSIKQLRTSEMAALIGEIIKRVPFEQYLETLSLSPKTTSSSQ